MRRQLVPGLVAYTVIKAKTRPGNEAIRYHAVLYIVPAGQSSGDVRLVDLSGSTATIVGRLEVYYNGQWGTVCEHNFGTNDGRVACRQLGFLGYTGYGVVRK